MPAKPASLRKILSKSLNKAGRIALVGIGSELHGDDAVGVLVARKLSAACRRVAGSRVRAFDGGTAPEVGL